MADFGLSTKLDFHYPKTATMKCGTMLFMAPQILCNYTYTKSVDIWSCAIIMFLLFHGKHPFYEPKMTSESYKNLIQTVKISPLHSVKDSSVGARLAQDFFERISKIEPQKRYTAEQALRHPWLTRNFDDEVPLSIHETFIGFELSHEISNVVRALLTVRHAISQGERPAREFKIPEGYLRKKEFFEKENYSLLVKSKSRKSAREMSLLSGISLSLEKENNEKQKRSTQEVDCENPTIMKLNSIFNNLFGRKPRGQLKTFSEGVPPPRDNKSDVPDISAYKHKIESEIQRAVQQFKSNLKSNRSRKILCGSGPAQDPVEAYAVRKEDKIAPSKSNLSTNKHRFRKKTVTNLRFYD